MMNRTYSSGSYQCWALGSQLGIWDGIWDPNVGSHKWDGIFGPFRVHWSAIHTQNRKVDVHPNDPILISQVKSSKRESQVPSTIWDPKWDPIDFWDPIWDTTWDPNTVYMAQLSSTRIVLCMFENISLSTLNLTVYVFVLWNTQH